MDDIRGEFPEYCYKACRKEEHANDIMQGTIHIGCLPYYRYMADNSRRDTTEGESSYTECGEVILTGYSPDSSKPPIHIKRTRNYKSVYTRINKIRVLCMSLPKVDQGHLNTFGPHIVKINDPKQLAKDIYDHFSEHDSIRYIDGANVQYDFGETPGHQLTEADKFDMSYKQKPQKFAQDCEFRIAVILNSYCGAVDCKHLDDESDKPQCELLIKLGKRLEYVSRES